MGIDLPLLCSLARWRDAALTLAALAGLLLWPRRRV
jgi:hypothetical protein